ncbi:NAD(P)-dependent oxidoreductase, partial [Patescibacteria group bacterium]
MPKNKPVIAFFQQSFEQWEKDFLAVNLPAFRINTYNMPLTSKTAPVAKDAEVVGVFIDSRITKNLVKLLPRVKLIATMSTGYDHIDLVSCGRSKIKVVNVPHYGTNTVAEHTFALILNLSRKIYVSRERTIRGDFRLDGLRGFDLRDKTIGIVGFGNIGQHVARIAHGFDMNIVAYDPHPRQKAKTARKYNVKFSTVKKLVKEADIVTLHAPYTKATHHLIDSQMFKSMKKNALLINTARGGLIKTSALVQALQRGQIGGAGLDVLEEEQAVKEEKNLLST